MIKFAAEIYKIGINPVVDPPDETLTGVFATAGRSSGPIPVRGRLQGVDFIQTLVKYRGAWRLYINGEMLKASGLKVGDIAEVEIEFDPRPRDVEMPAALRRALDRDSDARAEFEKLSPSRQKEIKRYIASLKTDESVARNIARVVSHLRNEKTDAQHALMRKPKK